MQSSQQHQVDSLNTPVISYYGVPTPPSEVRGPAGHIYGVSTYMYVGRYLH